TDLRVQAGFGVRLPVILADEHVNAPTLERNHRGPPVPSLPAPFTRQQSSNVRSRRTTVRPLSRSTGRGRNALHLAPLGLPGLGVDVARAALAIARTKAASPRQSALLVVEIVSPGSEATDWTVDQDPTQTVTMYQVDGNHYHARATMPLAWVLNTTPAEY